MLYVKLIEVNPILIKAKRKKHQSHKDLVTILKKGTPDEFREGMRRHLENHFVRILGATDGQGNKR